MKENQFRIYSHPTRGVFAKKRVWFFFWVTVQDYVNAYDSDIVYMDDLPSMRDYLDENFPNKPKKEKLILMGNYTP